VVPAGTFIHIQYGNLDEIAGKDVSMAMRHLQQDAHILCSEPAWQVHPTMILGRPRFWSVSPSRPSFQSPFGLRKENEKIQEVTYLVEKPFRSAGR
jgi:hypothetical protein